MWKYWLLRIVSIPTTLFLLSFFLFVAQNWSSHFSENKISTLIMQEQVLLSAFAMDELVRRERQQFALDKPLFYFSIQSITIPERVAAIYPKSHQDFVKKMAWRYGGQADEIMQLYDTLLHRVKDFPQLYSEIWDCATTTCVTTALQNTDPSLEETLQRIDTHQKPWKVLIPAIRLHVDCQYHFWLSDVITRGGGQTLHSKMASIPLIKKALKYTLLLTIPAFVFTWLGAFVLGIVLAEAKPKPQKKIFGILYILDGIPLFWLGLILLTFFSNRTFLLWFPSVGLHYQSIGFVEVLPYIILPVIAMTLTSIPYTTRQVHQAIAEVKTKAYITSAILKGISLYRLYQRHILPNAAITLTTVISEFLLAVIAGSLVIEVIFNIPGFGRLLTAAVLSRDFPLVALVLLFLLGVKMLITLVSDIIYQLSTPQLQS